MKVILSRKGFDSDNGGIASPILPDGTLLSLPIPDKSSGRAYSQLRYGRETYLDIMTQIAPKKFTDNFNMVCGLDPDIRQGIFDAPKEWKPAFGQAGPALSHLQNQGVGVGDLFLFYGWFKQTERVNGKLRYMLKAPNLHIIFGYLLIGEMVTEQSKIDKYYWHPHAGATIAKNCLFVPRSKDFGVFTYDKKLVLTKDDTKNRSEWGGELPALVERHKLTMTRFRQEYVIQEHPAVEKWAKALINGK